jgi:uncharacterized protein (TIGR00299 family) protein
MRILFLDCFSGISGDMAVGALCDLGADTDKLRAELAKLPLAGEFHVQFTRQNRCGIEGTKFDVHLAAQPHQHLLKAPAPHGRTFSEIRKMIESSELSGFVKTRAVAVFQRIAVAEGKIHGMPPDEVHFHEVGAVDSIVDIVGFCVALESLGSPDIVASALVEGSGFIDCAHGKFPLPAPATLEILSGIPIRQIDEPMEFITPTGAALLAEFAGSFGPFPALAVERIGYGVGTRNTPNRPNVLRAVLGDTDETAESDTITEIETNLDDMSPELLGAATVKLLAAGALDVFVTPIQMKKNRPGSLLTVIVNPARANEFARMILRETTAFGLRMNDRRRLKLRREIITIETPYGKVEIKKGWLGGELLQSAPEFESCRAVAEKAGVPVRDVYTAAVVVAAS